MKPSILLVFFGLILFLEAESIFGQGSADFHQLPNFRGNLNIRNDLSWVISRFVFIFLQICKIVSYGIVIVSIVIIGGTTGSFRDRIQRENDPPRPIHRKDCSSGTPSGTRCTRNWPT